MQQENFEQVKAFLKRAVDLESTIYTCNQTEQELQRRWDSIDSESKTVVEYKDGDLIPYEDLQLRNNHVETKQTLFGTQYISDYDKMSADYKRFHSVSDMKKGYSCPQKKDGRKTVGSCIGALIGGVFAGAVGGVIPGGIIGVVYGLYCGIRYGYNTPLIDMPVTMIKVAIGITIVVGFLFGIFAFIGEIIRDPNAPDKGYEAEREIYLNKLKERNEKLKRDLNTMQYCETNILELQEIRKRAAKDLEEHYANSLIFPKYHYFIAVAQILEYFESGRCETLAGADGAYNLYESELRQNIIISNLEMIGNTLEEIKDTMYHIYNTLQGTNNLLGAIDADLQKLRQSVDVNTSAIVAYGEHISRKLNWL